jgi:hypothetical protein
LFERPYYRKNVPDALKQFENKANMEYAADAANIRDMRFRKSNEYNVDSALKNRREDMISQAYANVDPDQAVGIHGIIQSSRILPSPQAPDVYVRWWQRGGGSQRAGQHKRQCAVHATVVSRRTGRERELSVSLPDLVLHELREFLC